MVWIGVPTLEDRSVGPPTSDHLILNEALFSFGDPLCRGCVIFVPAIKHSEFNPSSAQVVFDGTSVFCPMGPGIINVEAKVVQILTDHRPIRLHPSCDCLYAMIRGLDRADANIRENAADSLNIDRYILRGTFCLIAEFWWSTGVSHR